MVLRMAALAAGLLALCGLPALPPAWMLALGVGLAGLCLARRWWAPGLFLLGLCWACFSAQRALDDRLAPALDGQTLWLEGRVVGLPRHDGQSVRFELDHVQARRARLPASLRLSWFAGPEVRSGERWRLAVTLRAPRGQVNPGGFDHEAWLLAQRIGAVGAVKDGHRLAEAASGRWRGALGERLRQVDAFGYEAVIAALVLGDTRGLSVAQWQMLQDTGTVHLLVISGQHIGLFAGLLYGAVAGLARLGLWPLRWPWLPVACAAAMAGALGYGCLAGFAVPVQRACAMLFVVLLWRLRFRRLGLAQPLLGALCAVLVFEPLASLRQGFWLSFMAVAVLLLALGGRLGGWKPWQAWSRPQWVLAIGLMPLLVAWGLPVSPTGPLANLLAVPWVGVLVLPWALLGTALLALGPVGEWLLWAVGVSLAGLFRVLGALAAVSPALYVPAPPAWAWPAIAAGSVLLLAPAGLPGRWLGMAPFALLVWAPAPQVAHGQAQVWQLDVGQGLAVLVRTRQHALLYDTGPGSGERNAGRQVVLPSLRALGVGALDTLVISHAHLDHYGGAATVLASVPVARRVAGDPQHLPPQWRLQPCESGHAWAWDGVRFSQWRWADARESNPASCVLLIEAGGERLLLAGDIDAAAERALVAERPAWRADWLQAPHHGSRTSSSAALLDHLQPTGVLVPRGTGNRFGHPHAEVLARYQARGLRIHDTALHGALQLHLGSYDRVRGLREQRRFWRLR
ncbi:DNA internalization-related competence protein ComEC/Rec2 [Pseudomonas typographi]|uniref:DNA internalization-related competence protein ComEC/Rec2 n=1 Tax=Pseudomonas typographi TaxID=2715964 RepID=A0ABR7YYC8_9PSED|nr:DNA internalization-related competence protein ComEC/Rec2 [Pseudomonas typographi]MBD1550348.1 DNA internalization-related competence protein ComEC/Rec2 [Pseudomonas typographi]MBD1588907.1 DNA internalization-related competence protein ComEC/Rec2 [Pseudomonas typographi]MBD1598185.1 DNA internalization-related competence protein ComEC/Rec2 [Pseudomonas typographi]